MGRLSAAVAVGVGVVMMAGGGCRERAQAVQGGADMRALVQRWVPGVERASGLTFKRAPRVARRTRAQIKAYVVQQMDADLTPGELSGYTAAYRLFGLAPPGLDLRAATINVLGEQIAGYYDPDSSTLYIAADVDSFVMRTTASHELVHALQHQYTPLDSIIHQKGQNDRRMAAQAVLEGQATLGQTLVMMPELTLASLPRFSETRSAVLRQQSLMPEFSAAPLWMRESLIFPYLAGADFVRWFGERHDGASPFGTKMPVSTEQILHPDRYAAGDQPTRVTFVGSPPDTVRYEDGLGEFETRVLFQVLLPDSSGYRAAALAAGWDGDRYQVLGRDSTALALVWYSVWDDDQAADRFARSVTRVWGSRLVPAGRRSQIVRLTVGGRPVVRVVDAPPDWTGWRALPEIRLGGD